MGFQTDYAIWYVTWGFRKDIDRDREIERHTRVRLVPLLLFRCLCTCYSSFDSSLGGERACIGFLDGDGERDAEHRKKRQFEKRLSNFWYHDVAAKAICKARKAVLDIYTQTSDLVIVVQTGLLNNE